MAHHNMLQMPTETSTRPDATSYLALALISVAIMLDGFDIQLMGYVMPALLREWDVEKIAIAPVLMSGLVGMIIGSGVAGYLGDRFGRKLMLIISLFIIGSATLICALAAGPGELGAARFVTGLGMGGAVPNAIALIYAIAPAKMRVFLVAAATVFVPVGGAIAGLIAAQFMPAYGWKMMFYVGGVLPIVLAVIMIPGLKMPHSAPVSRMAGMTERDASKKSSGFSRAQVIVTIGLSVAFFSCLFCLYSMLNWLPTLMEQAGMGASNASLALTVVNVGGIVSALLVGWIAGKIGAKRPLVVMFLAGATASLALSWLSSGSGPSVMTMMVALALVGVATAGAQSVLLAFAAGVFEERYRATGLGSAVGFGRLGGIASAFAGAMLLAQSAPMGQFFLVEAVMLVIAASAVILIRPADRDTSG